MPRILLLTYHFPPASAVGALRPGRIARLLPEHGFEVDVVCASLDWGVGSQDETQLHLVPTHGRVQRIATPFVLGRHPYEPPGRERVLELAWWRARAYLEALFMTRDWSWRWGVAALRAVEGEMRAGHYDVVMVDAPPNTAIIPVLRSARRLGIPTVTDFRDIWFPLSPSMPAWRRLLPTDRRVRWSRQLATEALHLSDHVVFTSDEMVALARTVAPFLEPSRLWAIPNAFEIPDPDPEDGWVRRTSSPDTPLRIVYTGSLYAGRSRMVEDLIRGMGELQRRGGGEVELLVVGDDTAALRELAEEQGVSGRVRVSGWVDRGEVTRLQREAGALLLLQQGDRPGIRYATPAKLFEYMARRRHILGMVPGDGPAAAVIRQFTLGVVLEGENPEVIAGALETLVEQVRSRPYLPMPPEAFSEGSTVAQFSTVLRAALTDGRQ